jgi:hypothetical protein
MNIEGLQGFTNPSTTSVDQLSNRNKGKFGAGEQQTIEEPSKKRLDIGGVKAFPRRQEKIMIEHLRVLVQELRSEVERLKEANAALKQQLVVTEKQLHVAETRLDIQKQAWRNLANHGSEIPSTKSAQNSRLPVKVDFPGVDLDNSSNFNSSTVASQPARRMMPASPRPLSARQHVPIPPGKQLRNITSRSADLNGNKFDLHAHSGQPDSNMAPAKRPLSARNAPASSPSHTQRYTQRPNSARPVLGSAADETPFRQVEDGAIGASVPKDPLFAKFKTSVRSSDGLLSFGTFSANTVLSQKAAQIISRNMSEQSGTFESLGLYLMCTWKEVCSCTAGESSPNYFRLSLCCKIFDQVCGVVGMYSELLVDLRKEFYACLFQGFDTEKVWNGLLCLIDHAWFPCV